MLCFFHSFFCTFVTFYFLFALSLFCAFTMLYIYIYIYAFSRRFYPKQLTVHSGYTFVLSVCVFPGNRTQNLCAALLFMLSFASFSFDSLLLLSFLISFSLTLSFFVPCFDHFWSSLFLALSIFSLSVIPFLSFICYFLSLAHTFFFRFNFYFSCSFAFYLVYLHLSFVLIPSFPFTHFLLFLCIFLFSMFILFSFFHSFFLTFFTLVTHVF